MKALIVEDDLLQVLNLEALLELHGHKVCGIANSGESAIILAHTARPDILIMDMKLLGRLDGVETATRIVAARPCGLIFITAYNDGEMAARIEALTPEAVLSKPCRPKLVMEAIERIIDRGRRLPGPPLD